MNPGERLLTTYDALVKLKGDVPMSQTWARVFGLEIENPNLDDEVTDCLMAVRNQLDFCRQLLSDRYAVPSELLQPGFVRLREAASPAKLHASWRDVKGNIQPPECRQAFMWAAWVLREEAEEELSDDELQGLRERISALETTLANAQMSAYLRQFVSRQLELIRNALRLYSIQGVRPIHEALRTVAGDCTVNGKRLSAETEMAPEEARTVLAEVNAVITDVAEHCDRLDKLKTGVENAIAIATAAAPLLLQALR